MKHVLLIVFMAFSILANTAHHFQSDLVKQYPEYNIGDVFVFESADKASTVFILTANPSAPGKGGNSANLTPATAFGSDGLYNIHIATQPDIKKGSTYTFQFDGEQMRVGSIDNPNAKIGDRGELVTTGKVGSTLTLDNGIKIWSGRVIEPYFVDAYDFGSFHEGINNGKLDKNAFKKTEKDIFDEARISAIVVEIPNKLLPETVYVYGTTATQESDHNMWVQINRMGNVLVPYMFLWDSPTVRLEHDQHRPDGDQRHQATISNNVFRAVSIAGGQKDPTDYANTLAKQLTPDVLAYKVGTTAKYGIGTQGGRPLNDDPTDVVLSAYLGVPMTDYINNPKRYSNEFPYLNLAN
ncbi:DUF4331 family protein [Microbulbifer discodermiae]|uniref:DUF4331 family protein n=1 Tax=Microbulbifer sp. 2201CG32-9 TaxID=3232309 RepID=UPI00345BE11B